MKKILIVYAVEGEYVPVTFPGCEVKMVMTGVGKANAAMKLTRAICEERPDLVINMGTAGTLDHEVGDLFVCRHFVDRDYESVRLPGLSYEIVFSGEIMPGEDWKEPAVRSGICNTGDNFVTYTEGFVGDVVDMEAFALAVVCREFNIPLVAVKYVTDLIGQNSVEHWEDKLSDARKAPAN
ncbi:MAG: nucleosidase, partial [Bacteroides sp.]|nr:nucleosidase [Bacteroides sp.]